MKRKRTFIILRTKANHCIKLHIETTSVATTTVYINIYIYYTHNNNNNNFIIIIIIVICENHSKIIKSIKISKQKKTTKR